MGMLPVTDIAGREVLVGCHVVWCIASRHGSGTGRICRVAGFSKTGLPLLLAIEDRRKENEISKIWYKNRYPEAKQTPWDDPSGDLTVQKSVCRNRDDSLFIIPREAIPYDYIVLLDASRY